MTTRDRPAPRMAFPSDTRVGWIGAGVMGAALCHHVQRARYRLTLHSRTRAKGASILADGGTWATSSRAVAEHTDVVFTMVEGEVLYQDGRFLLSDEDAARRGLERAAAKLYRESGTAP